MQIKIQRVGRSCETTSFKCGNPSIEIQIKCSYFASLLHEGDGYEVLIGSYVVGYFMLGLTIINADALPLDDQEYFSGLHQSPRYGAIEIIYLAVEKKFQRNGIGSAVLDVIVANVRRWCQTVPIRYIVLDALKEKVEWYEQRGFFRIAPVNESTDYYTVKMLMDFCDCDEIQKYVEEST